MTIQRIAQPAPEYVPAHGLLAGRRVVVTAAAGAGIGAAAARRCLEEGADLVVLGDTHAGRLEASANELGAEFGAERELKNPESEEMIDRALDTIQMTASNARDMIKPAKPLDGEIIG